MVDPTKSLQSFQQALLAGTVSIQRCELDEKLVVHLDNPDGAPRFTYARLQGQTVAALVMLVLGWNRSVDYPASSLVMLLMKHIGIKGSPLRLSYLQ